MRNSNLRKHLGYSVQKIIHKTSPLAGDALD